MMRYISLSLILIVLLCYSGFRPDAFAFPAAAPGEVQSQHPGCHRMAQESGETAPDKESLSRESRDSASSCCFESLVNASIDSHSTARTVVFTLPIQMFDFTPGHTLKVRDVALKEHSPPELEIANSTLLL